MSYIIKNFSNGLLASSIGTGDSSLTVNTGHTLPTTAGTFVAVIWNPTFYSDPSKDPGTEIVLASYTSTNLYAITRAQESTSASSHPTSSAITCAITAGLLQNLNLGGVAFINSLSLSSGNASLLNDSSTPGNNYYYGTNGSGTKGFFVLPAGLGIPIPTSDGGTGSTAAANAAGGVVILDGGGLVPTANLPTISGSQVFTSSGTFTAPAGVTQVLITAIGAGAGGVAGGNTSSPGAGGSAGAMVINYPYTVTAGNSYTVTLNNPGGSGANGGTTVFDALTIAGGISGGGAGEPDGGASSGGTAGAGGFLTAKTGNAGAATGTGMSQGGGGGGGSMFGAGGAGASGPSHGAGSAGTGYGSGGGGGASGDGGGGGAGGSGTKGILIVQW